MHTHTHDTTPHATAAAAATAMDAPLYPASQPDVAVALHSLRKNKRRKPGVGLTSKLTESYGDRIERKWARKLGAFIESNGMQLLILIL